MFRSLVLGFASYFFYWVVLRGLNHIGMLSIINGSGVPISNEVYFLKALVDPSAAISFHEILYVCILSVLLGILLTVESTYKLTHRFFGFLRVTRKFGELDVWGYALNAPNVSWVTVRDLKEDLVYDGWIQAFSDDGVEAELLLGDVSVYINSTGTKLYEVSSLYVSRDRKTITLEFRDSPVSINTVTKTEEVQNATTTETKRSEPSERSETETPPDSGRNREEGRG